MKQKAKEARLRSKVKNWEGSGDFKSSKGSPHANGLPHYKPGSYKKS